LFTASGHFIDCNDLLLQLLDLPQSDLMYMALSEFIFPSDLENDKSALAEIFSGIRDCYEFTNGYLTTAGERVWAPLKIVSIPGAGGSHSQVLVGVFTEPWQDSFSPGCDDSEEDISENFRGTKVLDFERWKINEELITGN
jgi:hypothetical protein